MGPMSGSSGEPSTPSTWPLSGQPSGNASYLRRAFIFPCSALKWLPLPIVHGTWGILDKTSGGMCLTSHNLFEP